MIDALELKSFRNRPYTRQRICESCVQPQDEVLGYCASDQACSRCNLQQGSHIVQIPGEVRRKKYGKKDLKRGVEG